MTKKKAITYLSALSLTLSSCGQQIDWHDHLDQYAFAMAYHDDFTIVQLTDIHWNMNTSINRSKLYIGRVIDEVFEHIGGKIDLVELTGDQFMLANSLQVNSFIDFMETTAEYYGFKYAIIWGNHDRHGMYNPNWLGEKYHNAKHCFYVELDDNLYGRSNFVINLTQDGTNNTQAKWQIANLDSGASFSETALSISRDYDYIRKDQTQWWLAQHKAENVGDEVPTIAYYHIPQQDNLNAWNEIHSDSKNYKNKFFKLEGFGNNTSGKYDSDFITVGRENNLKAAFMGHAHNVDWTVEYNGVVLGLGVKTGPELYYAHIDPNSDVQEMKEGLASVNESLPDNEKIAEKFDLIGASLVTIKDESSFDLEHLYFNEREGADNFVRWVKW